MKIVQANEATVDENDEEEHSDHDFDYLERDQAAASSRHNI